MLADRSAKTAADEAIAAAEVVQSTMGPGKGGLIKKALFVTFPMWLAAVLIIFADVKPGPALPPEGDSGAEEGRNDSSRVVWLEAQLRKVQGDLQDEQRKVEALEADLANIVSPVVAMLDAIPGQAALASLSCAAGVLGIAGPSSFTKGYLAVVGSMIAGLSIAGCARFFSGGSPFWLHAVAKVSNGEGNLAEYTMLVVFLILGIARWLSGWECGIYAVVEEIDVDDDGEVTVLQQPLLSDRDGLDLPPPPLPPPPSTNTA